MPKAFISHSSQNRAFVEKEIIAPLKRYGIDTWYSKRQIRSATEWEREINKGLEECDWFILVISQQAIDSKWVKAEIGWAIEHRWGRIVTVLIEPCDVSALHLFLPRFQHIDYGEDPKIGREQLRTWVNEVLKSDNNSSAAPARVVLTILGAKGGVGKSTIACRMAEMIAETGHNILIIDLDTGAAGSTHLQRERGFLAGNSNCVYDILVATASGSAMDTSSVSAIEVTPDYLAERSENGRVFLLPAFRSNNHTRKPTTEWLQEISSRGDNSGIAHLMDRIMAVADKISVPIHGVIIDCGAEGAEFNPLVTEAHRRATLTYIVVQPDAICRGNLTRVSYLITQGASATTGENLRVIVNRLYSLQHAKTVQEQFSDFIVAGYIPDNKQLFEDTQKGHIDHKYGYDSLSLAVRGILAHLRDFPPAMIPDDVNLWVRPATRLIVDRGPYSLLKGSVTRLSLITSAIAVSMGAVMLSYAAWKFFHLPHNTLNGTILNGTSSQPLSDAVRHMLILLTVLTGWGAGMTWWGGANLWRWSGPILLLVKLQSIIRSSDPPLHEIEKYLSETYRDNPHDSTLEWLRGVVARRLS